MIVSLFRQIPQRIMDKKDDELKFIRKAITLSGQSVENGGGRQMERLNIKNV